MHDEVAPLPNQMPALISGWVAFADGWLANRRLSEHTRSAYRRSLGLWLAWCEASTVHPCETTFIHVNRWARDLERSGLAPASVSLAMSSVSSWYDFLVKISAIAVNPVHGADRPTVSRDVSTTVGLSAEEVDQLLVHSGSSRSSALICLMGEMGLRVSEALSLNVESLGMEKGHRVIRYAGKGGTRRTRVLSGSTAAAISALLHERGEPTSGPIFVTSSGKRLDRVAAFRIIRDLAASIGLENISPHSLRHSFATTARQEGVPLEDVQDAMGHADPRTTRRYDRDRHRLEADPSLRLAEARERRRHERHADGE